MIEKTVYVADDGKEFEDEEDCLTYEINIIGGNLKAFNYEREPIDIGSEQRRSDAWFFYAGDQKGMEKLDKIVEVDGYGKQISIMIRESKGKHQPLFAMYDRDSECWVNMKEKYKELIDREKDLWIMMKVMEGKQDEL